MYYWRIKGGRIWAAEAAVFVDNVPEGESLTPLHLGDEPAGVEYLRETILFYGFNLGELKNRLEKIQEIQAKYVPLLSGLQAAKAGAEMRDNADDVAEIKAEYVVLLAEMNAKIREVPND